VYQAVFARQNVNKRAEVDDALNATLVDSTHFNFQR